jgi:hypothetical protein
MSDNPRFADRFYRETAHADEPRPMSERAARVYAEAAAAATEYARAHERFWEAVRAIEQHNRETRQTCTDHAEPWTCLTIGDPMPCSACRLRPGADEGESR